jgi:uncharacterized SAM-binding protein YcdF (DUF218 family)
MFTSIASDRRPGREIPRVRCGTSDFVSPSGEPPAREGGEPVALASAARPPAITQRYGRPEGGAKGVGVVPRAQPQGRAARPRWRLFGALAGAAVAIGAVSLVMLWPRNDTPKTTDAVVVLGGAGVERVLLGIELHDRYGVPLVLSAQAVDYGSFQGLRCGRDVICVTPHEPSTAGEARAVRSLAAQEGWRHVTIATSRFHTTRARALFRQCLGDDVSVVGALPVDHHRGPRTYLREAAGTVAALTVRRAC